jgi:hypothetical protein
MTRCALISPSPAGHAGLAPPALLQPVHCVKQSWCHELRRSVVVLMHALCLQMSLNRIGTGLCGGQTPTDSRFQVTYMWRVTLRA